MVRKIHDEESDCLVNDIVSFLFYPLAEAVMQSVMTIHRFEDRKYFLWEYAINILPNQSHYKKSLNISASAALYEDAMSLFS